MIGATARPGFIEYTRLVIGIVISTMMIMVTIRTPLKMYDVVDRTDLRRLRSGCRVCVALRWSVMIECEELLEQEDRPSAASKALIWMSGIENSLSKRDVGRYRRIRLQNATHAGRELPFVAKHRGVVALWERQLIACSLPEECKRQLGKTFRSEHEMWDISQNYIHYFLCFASWFGSCLSPQL